MKLIKYTNFGKMTDRLIFHYDEQMMYETPKGKSVNIFNHFIYIAWDKSYFMFRFFTGYGFQAVSNKKKRTILLADNINKVTTYNIFGWSFKAIKPKKYAFTR